MTPFSVIRHQILQHHVIIGISHCSTACIKQRPSFAKLVLMTERSLSVDFAHELKIKWR